MEEEQSEIEELRQCVYESVDILLRALHYNAQAIIAAYNTSDADRAACIEYTDQLYDMMEEELDCVFGQILDDEDIEALEGLFEDEEDEDLDEDEDEDEYE